MSGGVDERSCRPIEREDVSPKNRTCPLGVLSVEELGNAAKRLCDHGYSIEE